MILARPIPVPNHPHRFLLQRGYEIPLDLVPRLNQLGIYEVWVRYHDLEFLEEIFDEELGERQREVYTHVRRNFEQIMKGTTVEIDLLQFQQSISGLFDYLRESPRGSVFLQKLDAFDNYLMSHSTNVCYLSLLLGMKLQRYLIQERTFKTPKDAMNLQQLGLGCLLHDVGKMLIEPAILNKPGKLTPDEMDQIKLHPTFGFEMVKRQVPSAAAQIVLNHHQRYNGEGYPARKATADGAALPPLRGKQIPIFSRIATVADVYDAATSARCYSGAKLPVQVLHEMRTWCQGFFDPVVERAFYQTMPPFPIGQVVTLSNGEEAAVVDFNPRSPVRPKVQCLRDASGQRYAEASLHEIDLAIHLDLQIAAVDGVDVRPYQATQQDAAVEQDELALV
jgi:HD-GYP domain-containing protein (c-di-GMP phosphodiesterase class II)